MRVRAAALNHLDLFVREGLPGLTLPMPFWTGCDIAGDVARVGAAVGDVKVGERVAVNPNLYCGRCEYCRRGEHSLCVRYGILGEHTHGGLAEYVKVEARHVLRLPEAIGQRTGRRGLDVQLSIIGSTMSNDAEFNTVMSELFAGRLRAIVDTGMPLREGVEAERRLAEGKQFGKIVLVT